MRVDGRGGDSCCWPILENLSYYILGRPYERHKSLVFYLYAVSLGWTEFGAILTDIPATCPLLLAVSPGHAPSFLLLPQSPLSGNKPFSPRLLFVRIFCHSDRKDMRTVRPSHSREGSGPGWRLWVVAQRLCLRAAPVLPVGSPIFTVLG